MDILAIQATDPVAEEAAIAHALLRSDVVERFRAIGLALLLDADDLGTWRNRIGDVRGAYGGNVLFLRVLPA